MNGLWRLSHFVMRAWFLASSPVTPTKRPTHPQLFSSSLAIADVGDRRYVVDGGRGHNKLLSIVRHCCHCSTLKWAAISRSFHLISSSKRRTRTDKRPCRWETVKRRSPFFRVENFDDCEQNNNGYEWVENKCMVLCSPVLITTIISLVLFL